MRHCLTAALLVAASAIPVSADNPVRATATPWTVHAGRKSAPAPSPVAAGAISFRVYEGLDAWSPSTDELAIGIDITASLTACDDGRIVVDKLLAGGWNFSLAADCPAAYAHLPASTPSDR